MNNKLLMMIFCASAFVIFSGCLPSMTARAPSERMQKLDVSGAGAFSVSKWNPSGTKIFVSTYDTDYHQRLYVFDTLTDATTLVYDKQGVVGQAWTRDGKFITASLDLGGEDGIWNINASGKNPSPSFLAAGHEASWSPDGNRLAVFIHELRSAATPYENESLQIISAQSSESNVVYRVMGSDISVSDLSWSPDGQFLTFSVGMGKEGLTIYRYNVNSQEVSAIAKGGDNWNPTWSPDSKFLAYIHADQYSSQTSIIISSVSANCRRTIPGIEYARSIDWSPNGRDMLVSWRNQALYILDLGDVLRGNSC